MTFTHSPFHLSHWHFLFSSHLFLFSSTFFFTLWTLQLPVCICECERVYAAFVETVVDTFIFILYLSGAGAHASSDDPSVSPRPAVSGCCRCRTARLPLPARHVLQARYTYSHKRWDLSLCYSAVSGEECSGIERRDLQALLVRFRINTLDTVRTGMSLSWRAGSMSVAQDICNVKFHTPLRTHRHVRMLSAIHQTISLIIIWCRQITCIPQKCKNAFKRRHACCIRLNRTLKATPTDRNTHSAQSPCSRTLSTTCFLHASSSFTHSYFLCIPPGGRLTQHSHSPPHRIQSKMFVPAAWAYAPARLRRHSEMKKGIKMPLLYTRLWLWSASNKGSDMESLLRTNSRGYTRCSDMNLWVRPNAKALDLNCDHPGIKHQCVATASAINLWIKRSWPFVFHLAWIKRLEEQGRRQRMREKETGRLAEGKEEVSSCSALSPHLCLHHVLFWFFNRWELPNAVHSIYNGSCSGVWTQPPPTTGKVSVQISIVFLYLDAPTCNTTVNCMCSSHHNWFTYWKQDC